MDDDSRKVILQSYADRLMKANTELAMSNQRCAFADHKLAASDVYQKRTRKVVQNLEVKIRNLIAKTIENAQQFEEEFVTSEELKEERRQRQLLEDEVSKLKKNIADIEAKKEIVEDKVKELNGELKKKSDEITGDLKKLRKERDDFKQAEDKLEQLKCKYADLKKTSDADTLTLIRIRKERNDLKQENSRIALEQKKLIIEYQNKLNKMGEECVERLAKIDEQKESRIQQLTKERDHFYTKYFESIPDENQRKEEMPKNYRRSSSRCSSKTRTSTER
uniref:Uncharacterized protein n=1 Tax=Panagrolaimus sp. JU765 TaxID=591449 RepID=A0AC34R3V1_9BILA